MNSSASEEGLKEILKENPGDPAFAELAELLRNKEAYREGMDVCLAGLSENPTCHSGRLTLARIYFDMTYLPFAVREVEYLSQALPENESVKKLLDKLAPGRASDLSSNLTSQDVDSAEETVAESDFDFDDLDLIEEDDDK